MLMRAIKLAFTLSLRRRSLKLVLKLLVLACISYSLMQEAEAKKKNAPEYVGTPPIVAEPVELGKHKLGTPHVRLKGTEAPGIDARRYDRHDPV